MDIAHDTLRQMYERMVLLREFDERCGRLMQENRTKGAVHLYCGEEAVAVGVCTHLSNDDYITSTHRGHGHLLAKGGDPKFMYAELFGRSSGYCKGKGGSMHIADLDLGMLGANGIVGAGPPIALGAAFACHYRQDGNVAVCFFGDGASNEGTFHEAANMAGLFRVPLVLVCENNLYGEWTKQADHQPIDDIADRAASYDMPGVTVDGMDAFAVYEAAGEAIARARRGEGPTLLECKTYRYYDHVGVDFGKIVRDPDEVAAWKARDPLEQFPRRLMEMGAITQTEVDRITSETRARIEAAVDFAEASPVADPAFLLDDVYTPAAAEGAHV
ncbi:MAG: thiamine pyrophosphate-dependent dehydrogenase E1 component subunit alpha [Chloroflexi bacterium]|nr:thiamine pyrophosphate-dependent dehydrogenase E1 component subunit alpha [Chloroflexota bacterium]